MQRYYKMISLSEACVVFDLDDTLYPEVDYQRSGFDAISKFVCTLFDQDVSQVISESQKEGGDVIEEICTSLSLPERVKESFIWYYRLHQPNISLNDEVKGVIEFFKENAKHLAIITDGREVSQKQKILALGIDDIPAFISESWGESKPGLKRFEYVMKTMPANHYIYIGDNLNKDFIAPNKLGWLTLGILDKGNNIHSQNIDVPDCFKPKSWLGNISEIYSFFE